MSDQNLAIYLKDHLAGSTVALELLTHLENSRMDEKQKELLRGLREDISLDRQQLEDLMRGLQVVVPSLRQAAAWFGEKALRIKLQMDDREGGDLRVLEALEIIATGIDGKHSLWQALSAASQEAPGLRALNYDRLTERARNNAAESSLSVSLRRETHSDQYLPVPKSVGTKPGKDRARVDNQFSRHKGATYGAKLAATTAINPHSVASLTAMTFRPSA